MKTKRTRWWLKSAALLCATVFGLTAFGDYYEWTSTDKGYWEDDTSWTVNTADFTDYRAGNTGSEIAFKTAATADDAYGVVIYNNTYSFSADDAAYGLTKANAGMYVSTWWDNGAVTLNVASGTYGFSEVAVNEAGANNSGTTAALNLNGGTLSAGAVRVATGGTFTLNGGTLATTSITGAGTLAIGANGGTFTNDAAATISVALTGSGTLTKTGAGVLDITGKVSNFKGKIVVDKDAAGYVTIGSETIYPGQTKKFYDVAWVNDFDDNTDGWADNAAIDRALAALLMALKSKETEAEVLDNANNGTAVSQGTGFARVKTAGRQSNLGSGSATYTFDEDYFAGLVNYEFSFAVAMSPGAGSHSRSSYLAIRGAQGILAVIEVPLGGKGDTSTATLYTLSSNGALVSAGTFTINGRGIAPENGTVWDDIVISANKTTGTTLTITRQGTETAALSVNLGAFDTLASLYVYQTTDNNDIANDWGFDNFVLKTPDGAGLPTAPVITATPDAYNRDRTVTITCEDENAKIYYCDSDSGEYVEYTAGTEITVSATTTISAYAKNSIGKSDTVSLVVYANVKLNAPVVARRGWYRLQITAGDAPIAGEEPQYVFSYVMNGCGTTPKTTETGDSALVRASSGAGFNVNGTWARVFAKADGYKDSDTVNYAGYTFDPTKFNVLYNMDWIDESINQPRSSVWPDDTMIAVDGVNYRSFGTGAKSYANDYFFVSADNDSGGSSRWDIYRSNKSSNGLRYNGATTVGKGRVLFKDVKPGTLIYLNSDELTDPVNMTLVSEGYTNADEYVYEVTGEGETVNATIKIGVNYGHIYCVKIYEPIPEETDTFAADEATLVDGAFTVPEGTTKITLGGKDVTDGFNIEGTTVTLLSPWFARNGEGMVVGKETVRLDIDLVEGLYYGPAAATTLEGLARPATLTMYDGTNAAALTTVAKPEGGTAFFTVYVDVKAE